MALNTLHPPLYSKAPNFILWLHVSALNNMWRYIYRPICHCVRNESESNESSVSSVSRVSGGSIERSASSESSEGSEGIVHIVSRVSTVNSVTSVSSVSSMSSLSSLCGGATFISDGISCKGDTPFHSAMFQVLCLSQSDRAFICQSH